MDEETTQKKSAGRKRIGGSGSQYLAFTAPNELIDLIDEYMTTQHLGGRAGAVRKALWDYLEEWKRGRTRQ